MLIKNRNFTLFAILFLAFCWPRFGFAQDYNTGLFAYRQGDFDIAFSNIVPLAEDGHADAQMLLSIMYYKGEGVVSDLDKSVRWLRESAAQDQPLAQAVLSNFYTNGEGVPRNYERAVYWARMSAENGSHLGQFNLASLYYEGKGLLQNYVKAHMWFNLSASGGHPMALVMRDLLNGMMTDEDIAVAQALARECMARQFTDCETLD